MNHSISIYGAQLMASTIYEAITQIYQTKVNYFIVEEREGNPFEIDGVRVLTLQEYIDENIQEQILIAVPEEHHKAVACELEKHGRTDYIFLVSQLRNQLLKEYYNQKCGFETIDNLVSTIDYLASTIDSNFRIFMVRSSMDRVQIEDYKNPYWMEQIQAGAKLDAVDLKVLRDDNGEDNISEKNRNYCELTVMYWIWKNVTSDYVGLCHYRRIFAIREIDILNIINNQVDVILPYPTVHFPNLTAQYKRYLTDIEWEIMRKAVYLRTPELRINWENIWNGRYFYNYNMLIARREVFRSYCEWIFDILREVERLCFEEHLDTSKRYAGYMGEILTTLYFMHYNKELKKIHIGVDILG